MRRRFAAPGLLMLWMFSACGGRYTSGAGDESSGSGGRAQGGRPGMSGASGAVAAAGGVATGTGGNVSTAGKAAGGGVGVAAASNTGGVCNCTPILCAPGDEVVPDPDGCCFHCVTPGCSEPCPDFGCAAGFHLEAAPGACCPTCVSDVPCQGQQADYSSFRQQLLDKYSSLGCRVDADCTIYWDKNNCAAGCAMYLPVSAVPLLDENLQSYAATNCSPQCPSPVIPCPPPGRPSCDVAMGRCTMAIPR